MVCRFFQLLGITAGQKTGTSRRAFWVIIVGVGEQGPFFRQPVKMRGLNIAGSVGSEAVA